MYFQQHLELKKMMTQDIKALAAPSCLLVQVWEPSPSARGWAFLDVGSLMGNP